MGAAFRKAIWVSCLFVGFKNILEGSRRNVALDYFSRFFGHRFWRSRLFLLWFLLLLKHYIIERAWFPFLNSLLRPPFFRSLLFPRQTYTSLISRFPSTRSDSTVLRLYSSTPFTFMMIVEYPWSLSRLPMEMMLAPVFSSAMAIFRIVPGSSLIRNVTLIP